MGAEVFSSTARGKTATEAFNAAVDEAHYEYGHRGYTGSIAEKGSFVMVTDEPMTLEAAAEFGYRLIDAEDERIDDKWGPSGCIPLNDGSYYFFGWSSC